jgi:hypothetical protein
MVLLLYMGLFLWLTGMLIHNSQLNHTAPTPIVYYGLQPKVMQPYLIFIPTSDTLLFVDLTGALSTLALGGLVGLNAALLVYLWRRSRGVRSKEGMSLLLGILPTMVPNLGLGCCPALPLLLTLLPSSAATFGLALGAQYGLTMGVSVALMFGATLFTLERTRRANRNATCPGLDSAFRHCTV